MRLLEAMLERAGPDASYTLEVRTSNAPAIALYERYRIPRRRDPSALLPGHRRGRPDHVADGRARLDLQRRRLARTGDVILALETSCDDTCASVVSAAGAIAANVISSQGIHDRYGGVVPEIASRHHLELIGDAVDDALARAPGDARSDRAGRGDARSRSRRARCSSGSPPPRRSPPRASFRWPRVDHLHGHVAASFLEPDAVRAPVPQPDRQRRAHDARDASADRGPRFEVIGQTLDDAAGEAFDKGARLLGLGYPGGAALERLARDGDPDGVRVPDRQRSSPGSTSRSRG